MADLLSKAAKAMSLTDDAKRTSFYNMTHPLASEKVFVDEVLGSDESGSGTESAPYKTPLHAATQIGGTNQAIIMIKKEGAEEYAEIAKSAAKKLQKTLDGQRKKDAKAASIASTAATVKEPEEEAIVEDESLPKAERIKIRQATEKRGIRVVVKGWIATVRIQSRKLVFIDLRDGSDLYLQCVLTGKLVPSPFDNTNEKAKSRAIQELTVETTIAIYGVISPVKEGKQAPGGHELFADYFSIISAAPAGRESRDTLINDQALPTTLYDQRHLVLRNPIPTAVLKVRSAVLTAFRQVYLEDHITEVTPPCMVQTQVEGGSTLFDFKYYGENAYLTQSSQLYLETALASLGDVYCIAPSFRAERSHTRRHLSEYTHIEAELAFLSFEEMLDHIEDAVFPMYY
jgi:asparaginyl-tRNA synthetase